MSRQVMKGMTNETLERISQAFTERDYNGTPTLKRVGASAFFPRHIVEHGLNRGWFRRGEEGHVTLTETGYREIPTDYTA